MCRFLLYTIYHTWFIGEYLCWKIAFSPELAVDLGFENAGFKTIYANEFDNYAADTFEMNFDVKVIDVI